MGYAESVPVRDVSTASDLFRVESGVFISESASHRLLEWGIPDEQIHELIALTGRCEYGLVENRFAALAAKDLRIIERDGQAFVRVPDFVDADPDKMVGQCSDLAIKWIVQAERSGLIQKLRDSVYQSPESTFFGRDIAVGISAEFFRHPSNTHVWIELERETTTRRNITIERMMIDPSFRRIQTLEDSGYRTFSYPLSTNNPLLYPRDLDVPIGMIGASEGNGMADGTKDKLTQRIIGKDLNGTYVYGFSWIAVASDSGKRQVTPVVTRTSANGDVSVFYKNPSGPGCIVGLARLVTDTGFTPRPVKTNHDEEALHYLANLFEATLRDARHSTAEAIPFIAFTY